MDSSVLRIARPRDRRIIGGVCVALADTWRWPPTIVRVAFVVATVATNGVGLLVYLALWAVRPPPPGAILLARFRRSALAAAALVVLYQLATTRGSVTLNDRPLRRADVVLLERDHAVRLAQTDMQGHFRLWHWPGTRSRMSLAICAPWVFPFVEAPAASAIFHTGYGLMRWDRFLPPPTVLSGVANLPASCLAPEQ